MPEEFAVDGAFGYCSAVDGYVAFFCSCAVVVYDFGEVVLADTIFTGDEYGEVGGGDFECDFDGAVEHGVAANDFVAVFDGLYDVHIVCIFGFVRAKVGKICQFVSIVVIFFMVFGAIF